MVNKLSSGILTFLYCILSASSLGYFNYFLKKDEVVRR